MSGNVDPMCKSLKFSCIVGGVAKVPIVDPENFSFMVTEDSSKSRIAKIFFRSTVIV